MANEDWNTFKVAFLFFQNDAMVVSLTAMAWLFCF